MDWSGLDVDVDVDEPPPPPTTLRAEVAADVFPASGTLTACKLLTDLLRTELKASKLLAPGFKDGADFSPSGFFKSGLDVAAAAKVFLSPASAADFRLSSGFEVTRRWEPVPAGTWRVELWAGAAFGAWKGNRRILEPPFAKVTRLHSTEVAILLFTQQPQVCYPAFTIFFAKFCYITAESKVYIGWKMSIEPI